MGAPCYEYPYSDAADKYMARSCSSEHHYDVPHLNPPSGGCGGAPSPLSSSTSSTLESSPSHATLAHGLDLRGLEQEHSEWRLRGGDPRCGTGLHSQCTGDVCRCTALAARVRYIVDRAGGRAVSGAQGRHVCGCAEG
ncbi:hypothetical protein LSTR_LSTR016592 [Laodelphax striatellus]|uniref:Uncharacterized protein n=1 Tax=Laodelphax striatellus TaxID=195883 RepID=A0A482X448_LAOST|nr:hypothetical protein LSTR_LSTR016592 [Laodelphax striatellus]